MIRRFEVNSRRDRGLSAVSEATVSLTVTAEGPGLSGPSEQTVTSSASLSDLFVTPDGLREVMKVFMVRIPGLSCATSNRSR